MKPRNLFIGLVFLLAVLTACNTPTREARRMVKRAERLADTLPDSTVRLIDSVLRMPASFSERERMDMALLQAEALFGCRDVSRNVSKNNDTLGDVSGNVSTISPIMDDDFFDDHSHISTSPELERAAAYYARKKQYAKAAHAALYSGFVQQYYNEKESAMRSFKQAEQYGKLAVDSLAVAHAEYWMGKMLINDGMEQEALKSFIVSESYIGNHYDERALIENSKAVAYILLSQCDSAEQCLRQSFLYAEKGDFDRIKRKIYNNCSVLYRLQGKYEQAVASLRQIMNDTNLNESESLMLYLNIGKTYYNMKKADSSSMYYQRVEVFLPNVNLKKETRASAYEALSHFAESQNNVALALQYREKHERLLYDVMIHRQEQTIYRIQQQYDYESLQNEMNRKIIQRHFIILIISILLLIVTIIVLVLRNRHKQLLESEETMKQQMDTLKQDLLKTVNISVLDREISTRLRMILKVHDKTFQGNDPKNEWRSLAWQIMNGKEDPFEAARSVLEMSYPNLYSTIQEN